jgi:riboflavin kinase/FMN adenylyltransferase
MRERVIALGFFDGVHLGHGALLRRTAEEAARRGCTPAVFTFDRPPKEVVTGIPCPLINSPEDRRELVRRLYGIAEVLMVPFDQEMMTTPWDRFITDIMVGRYHAVHLVAGHDHRFGHRNAGSPELLQAKCAQLGLGCDIIPKVEVGGITVSSTYIRRLLELGQVERAAEFLGHPHILSGSVRHGRSIGRSQLFPTANLAVPAHVLTPCHGVYVTQVFLPDGARCAGVTNVGTRPTVNAGSDVTVETYLLDYDGDLYGQNVRLEFCRRLRDEIRFDSVDALRARIAADAAEARDYFASAGAKA